MMLPPAPPRPVLRCLPALPPPVKGLLLGVLVLLAATALARAQQLGVPQESRMGLRWEGPPRPAGAPPALDRRLLLAVYRRDGAFATGLMRATDAAAYPLFYGSPVAAWGAALARGKDYDDAYRLMLSEGLAIGAALGLKKAFGRSRPYRALAAVRSRSKKYGHGSEGRFPEAFPSGHAATAFALATSWTLSHPSWYVAGPALAGAVLISTSRLWLGVHYPSDVAAGALLGAAAATGVYLLRGALTPGFLKDEPANGPPMVRLRVRVP